MVSWTTIFSTIFIIYVLNSVWTVYKLYVLPPCVEGLHCIPSYLKKHSDFDFVIYQSTSAKSRTINSMKIIHKWENFDYTKSQEKTVRVKMLDAALDNGTVFAHVFLIPEMFRQKSLSSVVHSPFVVIAQGTLTKYAIPEARAFNLLRADGESRKSDDERMSNHWKSHLLVELVKDKEQLPVSGLPREIIKFIKITPDGEYLPPMYIDKLSTRTKDLQLITADSKEMNLTISYNPISFGKLRLWSQLEAAMATMKSLGFTEKDVDEVKGIFTDTNFYLLCTTFMIAAVHLMFDILAFKNDIVFWSKKKSMVGLSVRTVIWRCISHTIIFLYLLDEQTSLIVLIPTGVGTVIEMWKVCKAFKVHIIWGKGLPTFSFGSCTEDERKTEVYDAQIMNYLLYVLYPVCVGGAVYSLIYMPHKSWYSWSIQSLVNGIYAFGFLFMLPQLFVNYKLKSVAHLPWKAFMYKAFNTFIDDVFAFIITMPTAHRVACFRDDVVFLIYLYQRWLYPVDKTRVDEFGNTFDDTKQKKH